MFSVIMPLYNKSLSVRRSIDSVLAQNFTDFELIVINDGSSDGSEKVVEGIDDPRVLLYNQDNAGVSVARNKGAELARGRYLAFIDADDEWLPQFLERMQSLIEQFPEHYWWGSNYARATAKTREALYQTEVQPNKAKEIDYFKTSVKDLSIHMTSIVFERACFLEMGGFPKGVRFSEDQDLFCRFGVGRTLPYLDEALTLYYNDTENRACDMRMVQDMPPYFQELEAKMLGNYAVSSQDFWVKEYLVERYLNEISLCFQSPGEKARGRQWLKLCKRTQLQKMRYYKACVYRWMPLSVVRSLVNLSRKIK